MTFKRITRRFSVLVGTLLMTLFLPACVSQKLQGVGLSAKDMFVDFKDSKKTVEVKRTDKIDTTNKTALALAKAKRQDALLKRSGIFSENGYLFVKTRGKSFLSVLDEAARLRRFNYTMLTDVSRFYIDYFDLDVANAKQLKFSVGVSDQDIWAEKIKQQKFSSVDEFVRTSVAMIKEAYASSDDAELRELARNLRYKWTGDGFVFYTIKKNVVDANATNATSAMVDTVTVSNTSLLQAQAHGRHGQRHGPELGQGQPPGFMPGQGSTFGPEVGSASGGYAGLAPTSAPIPEPEPEPPTSASKKTTGDSIDSSLEGYKKIFLFNLSEREVSFYLARLLNIPYADFSPNKPADLPRRNSSPMQLLGQGMQFQDRSGSDGLRLQPSDWQLNSQVAGGMNTSSDDPYGSVRWISIPQQNALIVKGKASVLNKISEILHAVDSDYKQIVIEAKIFQYSIDTSKRVGMALDAIAGKMDIVSKLGDATTVSVSKVFGSGVANALPANFYYLPAMERRYALLSALNLYGSDGVVRITAEPRILLKPGQVSTIDLTTTKLVQAVESNSTGANIAPPVQVEAGIFFTVKPTLLSDNKIQLDMFLKQSEFSSASEKNVLISTNQNQLSTSVVAAHNELVSLGGLERKKYQVNREGIPGLKDTPIIGNAFGLTEDEGSNTRVEFMIRAYVDQLDDQLSTPIKNINSINCKINKLINERLGTKADTVKCVN